MAEGAVRARDSALTTYEGIGLDNTSASFRAFSPRYWNGTTI
jgi:hypothetical protein